MKQKTTAARMLILVLTLAWALSACGSDMPFNGEVSFHEITLTIPEDYIRDSTESTEDLWIFEKGFYSSYILLSRQDAVSDGAASLDSYAAYLTEQGAQAQQGTFLDQPAVLSGWTREGLFCQELIFAWNGSLYAISLRGGTEEEFEALYQTIELLSGEHPNT